jgi:REP element-mobilizing transposase RayT
LYVHLVWATKNRAAVLDRALLIRLSRQAANTARILGAVVLATGGAPDHIHLVLRYRPDLSTASLARGLKAALTRTIRRDVPGLPDFAWQTGYGAFSVSKADVDRVHSYVTNQEGHHAHGTVWPEVEPEG